MKFRNTISGLLLVAIPLVLLSVFFFMDYVRQTGDDITSEYNEMLAPAKFQSFIRKGYSVRGNANYFKFYPPEDVNEGFVEVTLKFNDDKIIDKIAVLYVNAVKRNEDGSRLSLFETFYKPHKGNNRLRFRNILNEEDSEYIIGFFWKEELGVVDRPHLEKVIYRLSK